MAPGPVPWAPVIYVCGLDDMPRFARELRPGGLVSLLPPDEQPPTPPGLPAARHLRVEIHDVSQPDPPCILARMEHAEALVAFLREQDPEQPLLLHCLAGVSRSTAAALVALALGHPGRELEAARRLRHQAPHAHPNRRLVALADRLLGCEGRLVDAREAMGPPGPLPPAGSLLRLERLETRP